MHLVTNDSLMMVEYGNINRKQKLVNKHVKFHVFCIFGVIVFQSHLQKIVHGKITQTSFF